MGSGEYSRSQFIRLGQTGDNDCAEIEYVEKEDDNDDNVRVTLVACGGETLVQTQAEKPLQTLRG